MGLLYIYLLHVMAMTIKAATCRTRVYFCVLLNEVYDISVVFKYTDSQDLL